MNAPEQAASPQLSQTEQKALTFARRIFKDPRVNEKDPLTPVERNAINALKSALKVLKK